MKRIALLSAGSVSHEAVRYVLGDRPAGLIHYKVISDVFLAVVNGTADYAVIPIENTIEGSVSLHMDWLVNEIDVPMRAEWVYPSIQNLVGRREEFVGEHGELDFSKVVKVLSHPVAIAQCRAFIAANLPQAELENANSTVEGAGTVAANPGLRWAAFSTRLGAERHGLDILAEGVTDHDNNYTRFVLIGADPIELPGKVDHEKTSIQVILPEDYTGALHQVLSAFAWRRLNLSRIESRPTKKKLGNYYFYIDVMVPGDSILFQAAVEEIEALGCQVRILGSYPCFAYEDSHTKVK
ncbi:prephenate dehydratase [Saccharibacillus sp. CPCC 101409]|uniref:prephenate dehydratase n=1 Tax=Saccharibacillus sp. CPCC 101409 TaxID=3058041 RepID=UPI002673D0D2|nr:prephenate dehydratase [Saccharibacillus sp. CPCC 101409]MDO3410168.1 prephenate dehydratase [Saccharibacillus sp. CPCC 101409]